MPIQSSVEKINAGSWDVIHQKISLAGRLTDAQNEQSMSGVIVTLKIGFKRLGQRIAADGSFHFENLADGTYTLFVNKFSSGRKLDIALKLTTFKEIDGYIKPFKTIIYKKELSVSWLADKSMHVLDFEFKDYTINILNTKH